MFTIGSQWKCVHRVFHNFGFVGIAIILTITAIPKIALSGSSLTPVVSSLTSSKPRIDALPIQASAARFSPDGSMILVLGSRANEPKQTAVDNNISLWQVSTGKMLWQVKGVNAAFAKFSADGKTIACAERTSSSTATDRYTIRLRSAATGKRLPVPSYSINNYLMGVAGFALSPDGKTLALSAFVDHKLYLIDTSTGKRTQSFNNVDFMDSYDVAFSPDGNYLAASPNNDKPNYGLDNPQLIVWDIRGGRSGQIIYHHMVLDLADGPFMRIPVHLDPVFFTSDRRLIYGDMLLDIDWARLHPSPMISDADMLPETEGSRLFVGFIDQQHGSLPHCALFYTNYMERKTFKFFTQLELWDITTKKRMKTIPEPGNYTFRVMDYSPITHLIAHTNAKGSLSLQHIE